VPQPPSRTDPQLAVQRATRHFRFDKDGITNEIVEGRRRSTYFMPIARPKAHRGS